MLIASGTSLVLVTWLALVSLLALSGLLASKLTEPGSATIASLRRALWWGFLLLTLAVLAGSLIVPIGSTEFALGLAGFIGITSASGLALAWRRGWRTQQRFVRQIWLVVIPALLAVVALAAAALGPVTNYDSGLYHLGAIAYASDYSAIPGLANLYQPLGYATAQFPLAAALGIGPWGEVGFRLLNGLIITMVIVDLVIRLLGRRHLPGTWIQLIGTVALAVSMVALADYWVTSPSQDASVFALTIVAVAYMADALSTRRSFAADSGCALAIVIAAGLIRPTMVFFAVGVVVALLARLWSWRHQRRPKALVPVSAVILIVGGMAMVLSTARDYLLSGWFQFPLSLLAFDVPWRAEDPTALREATLGFHRDPEDLWGSVSGYEWVGSWLARAVTQWEAWLSVVMLAAAVALLLLARRHGPIRGRLLALNLLPSALAVVAWFLVSPPSFRFAWGPIMTLAAIPAGWGLWFLTERAGSSGWSKAALLGFAIPVAAISVVSLVVRTEWSDMTHERQWSAGVSIPYALAPVPMPEVQDVELSSGLTILVPVEGELCWNSFPLCTPRTTDTLRLAGETLQEGLLP